MKKNIVIFSTIFCFIGLILSSYEHGPAYEGGLNRTGSTGGVTTCNGSGCHGANATTTIVSVTISSGGVPVTQYVPGTTYDVAIRGHNTAAGVSSKKFGFQVSATLSGMLQAGNFAVTSGSHRLTPLSGIQIVEHKKAISDSATNYAVAKFTWTAPAAGSGTVKFYGILNSLDGGVDDDGDNNNNNNNDNDEDDGSGKDYPNTAPVVTLTEKGGVNPTTAVNNIVSAEQLSLFPNPCASELNIAMKGDYSLRIYAVNGATIFSTVVVNGTTQQIATQGMRPGVYYAEIMQDGEKVIKAFVKQ